MKRKQTAAPRRKGGTVSKFIGLGKTSLRTSEGRYLGIRGAKQQGNEEDSITRGSISCIPHQILLG
jgi:hypothetical protein